MVTLWSILSTLSKIAPDTFRPPGDPDGVQLGIGDEAGQKRIKLSSVAICLDVTIPVIIKCGEMGATLLIAHRSPFDRSKAKLTGYPYLLLQHLVKRKISVCVLHHNWTAVEGGLSDTLAQVLGFNVTGVFETEINGKTIPLGRICQVPEETTLKVFSQFLAKRLDVPFITYTGNPNDEVESLALVAGDGLTPEWLNLAWEKGHDTYLTGTLSHELATRARQLKVKIVAVPQAATEAPGMRRLTQILRVKHPKTDFTFIEPKIPYSTFIT
jgi:dinuclear metal center YbgI/SA1388 family protein